MKKILNIDILLATYQGESFLQDQIDSLLKQKSPNFRLLIRDDCSEDTTRVIIKNFLNECPNIELLHSDQRLGVIGNFSALMGHSKADYILFSDQDDVWLPNKIELSINKLRELESQYGREVPLLVHTDLEVVDSDLNTIAKSFWNYSFVNPTWNTLNHLLVQNCVTGCTMAINRSLLELVGTIPSQAIMHDWWIALVASLFGKIAHIPQQTILYRQHGKNSLGAQKMSIWKMVANRIYGKKDNSYRKYEQAHALLERYETLLDVRQKHILQTFLSLKTASYMKKIALMLKHRFIPRQ